MDDKLLELGIALAIGLIVGLERGWRLRDEPEGSRVAGLRTFGLAGLLGGVVAAVAESFSVPAVFAVGLVVFAGVFAWFEERGARSVWTLRLLVFDLPACAAVASPLLS